MALCGFYVLARLELGSVAPLCVPGLAIGAVAAGLALGALLFGRIRSRAAVRWAAAAAAVVLLWLFWLAVPMGATQADLPLAVAGIALLACSGAWRRTAFVAGGLICGAVVCALGLPGVLGLGPLVASGLAAVIGSGLADRSGVSEYPAAGRWIPAPRLLLAAALGAAGAMLLRNYLPVTRSLPYAWVELSAAFAVGWLLRPGVLRGPFSSPASGLVAACGIAFVAAFSGGSFWLFPDLVWSGSGAMQLPAEMLSAGRAFPVWLLAFGLGVVSGPALDEPFVGALPAFAAGAVASGLLGASYTAPLLLSLGLCLGYSGVVALWQSRGGGRRVLRWGGAALLAGLLAWAAAGDMWAGYPGLKRRVQASASVEGAASHGRGQTVVLSDAQGRWEFLNGALVSASGEQGQDLRLLVALALAYGDAPGAIGLAAPALPEMARGVELLAGEARITSPAGGARFDAIIAGPGPLCGAGNPMRFRFLEALQGLRARLSRDGVLAMWIPVGAGGLTGLRRHLATFQEVFPRFDLYVRDGGAVLVAGGDRRLVYGRLLPLFGGPGAGWLESGGYWEPIEVLSDFVAEGEQLSGLIRDAAPYRWSRPGRPPGLARDLARAPDIVSAAALLQYRTVGPGGLPGRIEFSGDRERLIALRGFAAFYRGRSQDRLRRLGQGYPAQRGALVEFVEGPFARRDLLVGEQTAGPTAAARALRVFGLHDEAIEVLERGVQGTGDSFAARKELVEALADAQRPAEALPHCRRAVEMRPDSAEMSRRLAALLLATNQRRKAAETLEGMIARGIHGNLDVLMLARLRLQAKDYADAARLAQRVLDNDPDNTQARLLLQMAMGQTRGGT